VGQWVGGKCQDMHIVWQNVEKTCAYAIRKGHLKNSLIKPVYYYMGTAEIYLCMYKTQYQEMNLALK
jgi:hypothetical protein